MFAQIENIPEKELQQYVHYLLSDPSIIRTTVSGKRLQILSPGRLNIDSGPDFVDMAIMLKGEIIVGDAEFHRKSSEWIEHKHQLDPAYKKVILHIIIENDRDIPFINETLIIDLNELKSLLNNQQKESRNITLSDIEDIQHFALLRLLRKTADAQRILNKQRLAKTFEILIGEYLKKYYSRKKRPVYELENLAILIEKAVESEHFKFLEDLERQNFELVSDRLFKLLKVKIYNEGSHLRREIVLNCVLPLSLCIANEAARISLFQWYWSTPALVKYGKLERQFPNMPQNYLWQQQGMLEYLQEYGKKPSIISETVKEYGFAQILSFYRLGGLSIEPLNEE